MRNSFWKPTWAGLAACALLAACGGGSGDGPPAAPSVPSAPTIIDFSAERPEYWVGETVRLRVRYTGGAGRLEPGLGAVADGATFVTPALDGDRSFRLIVEGPQGRVERELRLPVKYRDQYITAGTFLSVGHEAVALQDGSVLLIGGSRQENVLSHRITRFDPQQRSFNDVGQLLVGRLDHRATLLTSGDVLITGGETSLPQPRLIELLNPRTGAAQAAGALALRRSAHTATLLDDGRVLIAGGYSGSAGVTDRAEIWDPRTRQSTELATRMASPRAAHTATLLKDGRVLLIGGFAPPSSTYSGAEVFDPRTSTFQAVSGYDSAMRLLHAAKLLDDGSVLIVGGEIYDAATDTTTAQRGLLRYDPVGQRLAGAGQLSAARSVVRIDGKDGRWFAFGGLGAADATMAAAESFSAEGNARVIASLPSPRAWHTVTRLHDGRFLIAGGQDSKQDFVPSALLYE